MHTQTFHASVQYEDLKGTAAADRADMADAEKWLTHKKLMHEGEYLLGIKLWVGENHGTHKDPVSVTFLLAPEGGHDDVHNMIRAHKGPVVVRKVTEDLSIAEFFGLFKRFSVTLSPNAMLEGCEITYPDY